MKMLEALKMYILCSILGSSVNIVLLLGMFFFVLGPTFEC